jgi:hypothetical protein
VSAVPNEVVARIRQEMVGGYDRLLQVAATDAFQRLLGELYELPPSERPHFVTAVILRQEEREARGVFLPDDILVLRSAFGDRRPTLFCLKRYLSRDLHRYWQNVNLTFDNAVPDETVPRDERAWRKPLAATVQAAVIANGLDAEAIDSAFGGRPAASR